MSNTPTPDGLPVQEIKSPNDAAFAVAEADVAGSQVRRQPWNRAGAWKWREFGAEVQLRNASLPWLALDLFRSEAEDLALALGFVLKAPMPMPYRVSVWHRVKQWWLRVVWKRKHYAELNSARNALIEDFTRRGPWG